jgi:hypothetical protein
MGGPTVIVADDVKAPEVAVIWVVPCPSVVTSPVALTVATLATDEVQLTPFVRF